MTFLELTLSKTASSLNHMYVRASSVLYCGTSHIFKCALLLNARIGFVIEYRKFNLVMYIFLYVKSLLSSLILI